MKRLLWCCVGILGFLAWSCQTAITLNPGEFGSGERDAGGGKDGQKPSPKPDTTKPEPPQDLQQPDTPGHVREKPRKIVMVEGTRGGESGAIKLWVLDTESAKKQDITPREALKNKAGVYIAHHKERYFHGSWPNGLNIRFHWSAPAQLILIATIDKPGDPVLVRLFDLQGKQVYVATLSSGIRNLKVGPRAQDIWYEGKGGVLRRWRRAGAAPPPPERIYSTVRFDKSGNIVMFASRQKTGSPLELSYANINESRPTSIKPHIDPKTKKQVECTPLAWVAKGILCQETRPTRGHLWYVTTESKWTPLAPNHDTAPERSESFVGLLASGTIAFAQTTKDGTHRIYTFAPATQKRVLIRSSTKVPTHLPATSISVGSGLMMLARTGQQPTLNWTLSYAPEQGPSRAIKADFTELEPGYELGLSQSSHAKGWALLTSTWYLGRAPSKPGLLGIYGKDGKELLRREVWSHMRPQISKDGDFVTYVNLGSLQPKTKREIVWVTLSTTNVMTLPIEQPPALFSLVP